MKTRIYAAQAVKGLSQYWAPPAVRLRFRGFESQNEETCGNGTTRHSQESQPGHTWPW